MNPNNLSKLASLFFGVLVLSFLIGFYTFAWVGPSEAPPGGNPPPPLLLAPSAIQTDASSTPSIWINKTAVSNILELKAGGTARFIIGYDGNVGIGATPNEKLTVGGAINLGTTANFNAGTIRWTGTDFEGYTGTAWTSLTAPGGAITFLALTDTPGSYSGQAGKYLKVNAAANAVEFAGILAADLPSSIDAAKIGGGTVDNTEFSYLNGVTSALQTQ